MKNIIKNILKGMVMGIANVIPGVSGGTMAVAMGIYDGLIHAATHIISEFKKSIKFLIPIVVGMLLGIVALSKVIGLMFDNIPIQTNMLFIGLILGGLPPIVAKVKGNKIKVSYVISFLVFFVLVVGLAAVGETDRGADIINFSIGNCFILLLIGIVAAATMVVPGVSGSMVLMLLGYYNAVIGTINSLVDSLVARDVSGIVSGALVLIPFGIGVVVGIFGIAKLIEIIFTKYPQVAYYAILGLIIASPFAIVLLNDFSGINVVSVLTGIVALAVGFFIALKLGGEE